MAWTLYRSDDAGAPVLNGTAGSLIAVLDAILLNGYGDKPALGWEKAFSGTNKAVYRALTGNRHYLRVSDTGTTSARVVGYESMSDVDTGTYPFPTNTQMSGGLYVTKAGASDSTPRVWICFGNEKTIYLFTYGNSGTTIYSVSSTTSGGLWFGEAKSYVPGDVYATFICAGLQTGVGSSTSKMLSLSSDGNYIARGMEGAPGSYNFDTAQWTYDMAGMATIGGDAAMDHYPSPLTGQVGFSPVLLLNELLPTSSRRTIRAEFPRIFAPLSYLPGSHLDIVEGQGELAGVNLLLVKAFNLTTEGRLALQISGDDL